MKEWKQKRTENDGINWAALDNADFDAFDSADVDDVSLLTWEDGLEAAQPEDDQPEEAQPVAVPV